MQHSVHKYLGCFLTGLFLMATTDGITPTNTHAFHVSDDGYKNIIEKIPEKSRQDRLNYAFLEAVRNSVAYDVGLLIHNGADPHIFNDLALVMAAENKHNGLEIFRSLVEKHGLKADTQNNLAIWTAARTPHPAILLYVSENPANYYAVKEVFDELKKRGLYEDWMNRAERSLSAPLNP